MARTNQQQQQNQPSPQQRPGKPQADPQLIVIDQKGATPPVVHQPNGNPNRPSSNETRQSQ